MKIFIAGHNGMVGSAILRALRQSDKNFEIIIASRKELDLTNQADVMDFMQIHKPDQVYLAAAKVGGIYANDNFPASFIYENLMIQNNVINSSFKSGVNKLLFLGSSCIYPRICNQPMSENSLLSDYLEPTNEPYAVAKIAGIKMCESYNRQYGTDYRSVMPTNLYGPNDNYHSTNSHVIPALIKRIHFSKQNKEECVSIWGSGNQMREFLHVDDMASASIFIQNLDYEIIKKNTLPMCSHINVGSGRETSIKNLAKIIKNVVGYEGLLTFDSSKPDGAPKKLMDSSRLSSLGWNSSIKLEQGIVDAYNWFLKFHGDSID